MGSHITWMLFALHVPCSKFCKDGLMMFNWPKRVVKVRIKQKYIVVFDWNLKLLCRLLVKHFKLMRISKLQNIHACIKLFYISEPTVNAIAVDSRLSDLLGREGIWRMRYFRSYWIPNKVKKQIIKIFLDYFVIFITCH
jgi:hypothetical protein